MRQEFFFNPNPLFFHVDQSIVMSELKLTNRKWDGQLNIKTSIVYRNLESQLTVEVSVIIKMQKSYMKNDFFIHLHGNCEFLHTIFGCMMSYAKDQWDCVL